MVCIFILEGKSIKSNAEKNKIAARKWKELLATEKDEYFKQAKEQVGIHQAPKNSWKEASRIIKNMEANVSKNFTHTIIDINSCCWTLALISSAKI